jgi:glucose/mannose-6-phosphate isomerase
MPVIDLDGRDRIERADPGGMLLRVERLGDQCREAVEIGRRAALPAAREVRSVLFAGMGGSAIGGDLLGTCFAGSLRVPWVVHRDYGVPGWVDSGTLVVASSYSGDTEEALEAFEGACERGATVLCLTSGGELGRRADARGVPVVRVPGGGPPRAALGYSFFPLAVVLGRLGLVDLEDGDLEEGLATIGSVCERCGRDRAQAGNPAKSLAASLSGALPVLYSGPGILSAVAVRWKGQLHENAKVLAHANLFPELDHNEIEGWENAGAVGRSVHVILLRDAEDSVRMSQRMAMTLDLIAPHARGVTELVSEGRGRIARMFSLVVLGDFTSVYLAFLGGVDPTPVGSIESLKRALGKIPAGPRVRSGALRGLDKREEGSG